MSKTQETWNKKEREKKKQKAKNDKQEKKQWRKDNPQSKNANDMIAYVDENGNLCSTPPDPRNKIQVKVEDIIIGVPKYDPTLNPVEVVRKGIVTFFNEDKGFGFIVDSITKESIFVHISALLDKVKENSKVTFEVEMGPRGVSASKVKIES